MTDILYITRAKLSLRRAHVHNILRTADALSRAGFFVTVLTSAPITHENDIRRANGIVGNVVMAHTPSLMMEIVRKRGKGKICYLRDPLLWHLALLARFRGFRIVAEIHGSRESFLKRLTFPLLIRVAHGVLFITERLRVWYGTQKKPIAVIPCVGIRQDEIDDRERFDYRQKFGLAAEDMLAVYIGGGMGKYYDLSLPIRALPLCDEHIKLIIVGMKDEELSVLRTLATSMHVGDRFFSCDRFDPKETLTFARGADFLVCPKIWAPEGGISAKYYAYLASGRPSIVVDSATDREVLSDNVALLISPSPEAFASAMSELAHNESKREVMGERAREHAKEFSEAMRTRHIRHVIEQTLL